MSVECFIHLSFPLAARLCICLFSRAYLSDGLPKIYSILLEHILSNVGGENCRKFILFRTCHFIRKFHSVFSVDPTQTCHSSFMHVFAKLRLCMTIWIILMCIPFVNLHVYLKAYIRIFPMNYDNSQCMN